MAGVCLRLSALRAASVSERANDRATSVLMVTCADVVCSVDRLKNWTDWLLLFVVVMLGDSASGVPWRGKCKGNGRQPAFAHLQPGLASGGRVFHPPEVGHIRPMLLGVTVVLLGGTLCRKGFTLRDGPA